MFLQLALRVNELCLIQYNILFVPVVLHIVHVDLTVLWKPRNVKASFLAEWVLSSFTSLDHSGRGNNALWVEVEEIVA